ncbi:hypothetical protein [Bremerella alba]|nr:hypothetical protein [Bremerella alba]
MPKPRVIGIVLAVLIGGSFEQALANNDPPELECHFIAGNFRILYTLEGKSSVSKQDQDQSGVPDRIENLARQLNVAYRLYCEVLEFPDPLQSSRFKEATCIQVVVHHRENGNGTAYDELSRARPILGESPEEKVLVISIGTHVDPIHNVTPAHELFHLIQYGATYFKNRWYLEGMTRWAEHGISSQAIGDIRYDLDGPWPQSSDEQAKLFYRSYDAEYTLWNPIAAVTDDAEILPRSTPLRELASVRYSDGTPVMEDLKLRGAAVMRDVLVELRRLDDIAFQELSYQRWSEANQVSENNNRYIYQGIMRSLKRHGGNVVGDQSEGVP